MTPQVGTREAVMDWARMLAYFTGTVDQELLARNEYLTAENRILKAQLNERVKLSDACDAAGPCSPNRAGAAITCGKLQ